MVVLVVNMFKSAKKHLSNLSVLKYIRHRHSANWYIGINYIININVCSQVCFQLQLFFIELTLQLIKIRLSECIYFVKINHAGKYK